MCGKVGIHSGMGIFQSVASYVLREEKKVVTVEDGDGGVYHSRVRAVLLAPLLTPPKFFYTFGYSP